jgi:3-hydroxyacyl-[acyl-carrier-protein] dehydratase
MTEINIKEMDIHKILELIPHRYPFVMVDRVLEYEKDKGLIALKNVTFNEPFFTGHFPENPVMPGVLMVEALAQAAGLLVFCITKEKGFFYFAGVDNVRFKRIVKPGDQLYLHVNVERHKGKIWKFNAKATVDGEVACTADLMIAGE